MASPTSQPIENAFSFCPRCGASNPDPGSIPFHCTNCEFAFYFGPVAAVGALVLDDQDRLLVVRRARDPGKNQWGLPGGFVDRGETIEEALSREVLEETQLTLSQRELMMTGPNRYTHHGVTSDVIDLFYVCRVESAENIQLASSELCEYRWCIPDADILGNMAFESNRIAIERWLADRNQGD
ncbi:NUDIX hydrolase [Aporhodopirellula aestuarii]|uniref:NUDIX domain-containing protein n=1 Tax=Aporhodopirellula aestuarii TaxID=2950107 RepID=A0ABT0U2D7_9BACT|nr:NUDIX domain-containing protein [Aporhodopirellula aestuarii]MCM2371042.1 NUDIX domain-containing protein [Aporhodopirellula aestuarii]